MGVRHANDVGWLGSIGIIGSAQGTTLWNDRVGQWHTGAYSNEKTGTFTHSAAAASYNSGVLLLFSLGAKHNWSMGFANDKWRLKSGSQYSVRYWIDTGEPEYATAVATSEQAVEISLKDSIPLFNSFRRGNTLYVSAQNTDFTFNLTDSSRVLTYLLECVKADGRKPVVAASVPNPFGSPAVTRDKGSSVNSTLAERAEATTLAANLLSALGTPGFKILQPDEMPEGLKSDAMWRSGAGIGTVNVLPSVTDIKGIPSVLISGDAKGCKKAFASGSLPAESGLSPLTRLFTRCGKGKDAIVGIYLIIPRRAGGAYVIGTFSVGEGDAANALDSDIRQAIFRALPK